MTSAGYGRGEWSRDDDNHVIARGAFLPNIVGLSGFEPPVPTTRMVVPDWIEKALHAAS